MDSVAEIGNISGNHGIRTWTNMLKCILNCIFNVQLKCWCFVSITKEDLPHIVPRVVL